MNSKKDKFRNERRRAFTRNFSKYCIDRYILIDNELMDENKQNDFVNKVNETLWLAIQEVNMLVEDRLLPFVHVKRVRVVDNKLRIVVNDYECPRKLTDYDEAEELNLNDVSHLLIFKPLSPQRHIMHGDKLIPGNARMLLDDNELVGAAADIFLDIAMFNSYSFLVDMTSEKKQQFSNEKFSYYRQEKLDSYYEIDETAPPAYFSFAFYARETVRSIDFDRYVWIWNKFISTHYGDKSDVHDLPYDHIKKYYRDKDNLEGCYLTSSFWNQQTAGAKLLLRINREPNTNERKQMICAYFGIKPFRLGAVKIVPINEYYKPFIQKQLAELYITAFKVIV